MIRQSPATSSLLRKKNRRELMNITSNAPTPASPHPSTSSPHFNTSDPTDETSASGTLVTTLSPSSSYPSSFQLSSEPTGIRNSTTPTLTPSTIRTHTPTNHNFTTTKPSIRNTRKPSEQTITQKPSASTTLPPTTSTSPTSTPYNTLRPTQTPTAKLSIQRSPLLEMILYGFNTTLQSTIAQNHWRDVTSNHVQLFWNQKYSSSSSFYSPPRWVMQSDHTRNGGKDQNISRNRKRIQKETNWTRINQSTTSGSQSHLYQSDTSTNNTSQHPMILITFTLVQVDTFIETQDLIQRPISVPQPTPSPSSTVVNATMIQRQISSMSNGTTLDNSSFSFSSLARPTIFTRNTSSRSFRSRNTESVTILTLANRIQYIQQYTYNITSQTVFVPDTTNSTNTTNSNVTATSDNDRNNITLPTFSPSPYYTSNFFNVSEYIPILPFLLPSDINAYVTMLKSNDPTPNQLFSSMDIANVQVNILPSTPISTSYPTTNITTRAPSMTPSPHYPPTSLPTLEPTVAVSQKTNAPMKISPPVNIQPPSTSKLEQNTIISAVATIVIAGVIIIAWAVWYLFFKLRGHGNTLPSPQVIPSSSSPPPSTTPATALETNKTKPKELDTRQEKEMVLGEKIRRTRGSSKGKDIPPTLITVPPTTTNVNQEDISFATNKPNEEDHDLTPLDSKSSYFHHTLSSNLAVIARSNHDNEASGSISSSSSVTSSMMGPSIMAGWVSNNTQSVRSRLSHVRSTRSSSNDLAGFSEISVGTLGSSQEDPFDWILRNSACTPSLPDEGNENKDIRSIGLSKEEIDVVATAIPPATPTPVITSQNVKNGNRIKLKEADALEKDNNHMNNTGKKKNDTGDYSMVHMMKISDIIDSV